MSSERFRLSALFPFVTSSIAFALILVLVLSGTNPDSVPDGYLLSFNTTSVGKNLVQFSPITPTTSTTAASLISNRSVTASPNVNVSMAATSNSNSTTAAPTLVIPQTTAPTNPAAIPIALIGTFFQLTLNTFASGMGDTLQNIVTLLVTTGKQTLGVNQFYTMHLTGLCEGTVLNATATNATSPFNVTRCMSYQSAGNYIANLTRNVSSSTLVGATNITVPALSKVPGVGQSASSFINIAYIVIIAVFVIALIGNGLSIILSAAAFFAPSYGKVHTAGAVITTLSTQLLQSAAITSTVIAISINSSLNKFSDVSGLSVTVGGKFLALIWVGYIAAQMANGYWATTWFVRFREISYKARRRTAQQMGDYKGIKTEVLSDLRVQEMEYGDIEVLTQAPSEIRHWNDTYKQI